MTGTDKIAATPEHRRSRLRDAALRVRGFVAAVLAGAALAVLRAAARLSAERVKLVESGASPPTPPPARSATATVEMRFVDGTSVWFDTSTEAGRLVAVSSMLMRYRREQSRC